MWNLFNRKSRKKLEGEIELLNFRLTQRDNFIDRIVKERNEFRDSTQELKEAAFELQKRVVELEKELVELKGKNLAVSEVKKTRKPRTKKKEV